MRPFPKRALLVAGTLTGGAAAALGAAAWRWDRATAAAVDRLGPAASAGLTAAPTGGRFDPAALDALPAPVARYFRYALPPGQPLVRHARIEHVGTFASAPGAWAPFRSVQHVGTGPVGFVWDARVRMGPGLTVRVRDAYLDGTGAMFGAVAGLVPVADAHGTPAMAEASLQRYLAEAPWYPTALLPAAGVVWTPVDAATARAALTDRGTTAVVTFGFGPGGEIVRATADRYRDVNGTPVLTPWEARLRTYARVGGVLIPTEGEVMWHTPEGPHAYWRGRVVAVAYDGGAPEPVP